MWDRFRLPVRIAAQSESRCKLPRKGAVLVLSLRISRHAVNVKFAPGCSSSRSGSSPARRLFTTLPHNGCNVDQYRDAFANVIPPPMTGWIHSGKMGWAILCSRILLTFTFSPQFLLRWKDIRLTKICKDQITMQYVAGTALSSDAALCRARNCSIHQLWSYILKYFTSKARNCCYKSVVPAICNSSKWVVTKIGLCGLQFCNVIAYTLIPRKSFSASTL